MDINTLIEKLDGRIVTIDPKNSSVINPLETDEMISGVIDVRVMERLNKGGFKTVVEVMEYTEKFKKAKSVVAWDKFREWWESDGTKDRLINLVEELNI